MDSLDRCGSGQISGLKEMIKPVISKDSQEPLSADERFRRKYPLGIEVEFEKEYGRFPSTEEMCLEIKRKKKR